MDAKAYNKSTRALFLSGGSLSGLFEQSAPAEEATLRPYVPKTIMPDKRFENVMLSMGSHLQERHVKVKEVRTIYDQMLYAWKEYQAWLNGDEVRAVNDDDELPF